MEQTSETQTQVGPSAQQPKKRREAASRWVPMIAALLLGVLFAALPESETIGPGWLFLAIEVALLTPFVVAHLIHHPLSHRTARMIFLVVLGLATLALAIGVVLLIVTLPKRSTTSDAGSLLRTGALLWLSNITVFGLWYWEIDGGGPIKRHEANHQAADFLFPQQADGNTRGWVPHFIDYLFVAFTGATALSPTDTYPLTRTAKGLMMLEAIIALIVLAVLIGRAVNII